MQNKFVLLMCLCSLVGFNLHAEETNAVKPVEPMDVIKTIPYKLKESGSVQEVSTTPNTTAFLVTPPPESFILRNSVQVLDSNSKELPLKVIGSLKVGALGDQKQLIINDPFRVMVDLKQAYKTPKFLSIMFTACKSVNVCFNPIRLKVMLDD